RRSLPDDISQTLTEVTSSGPPKSSSYAVLNCDSRAAKSRPSGEKARCRNPAEPALTASSGRRDGKWRSSLAEATSQTRAAPSKLPEASALPSGLNVNVPTPVLGKIGRAHV